MISFGASSHLRKALLGPGTFVVAVTIYRCGSPKKCCTHRDATENGV
jgi:hypothetical protein